MVFCIINFTWIFFRANSVEDIIYIFVHLMDGIETPILYFKRGYMDMQIDKIAALKIIGPLGLLVFYDCLNTNKDPINLINKVPKCLRWAIYYGVILLILCIGNYGQSQFIYFQF